MTFKWGDDLSRYLGGWECLSACRKRIECFVFECTLA